MNYKPFIQWAATSVYLYPPRAPLTCFHSMWDIQSNQLKMAVQIKISQPLNKTKRIYKDNERMEYGRRVNEFNKKKL